MSGMPLSKTGETYNHAQLGPLDMVCVIEKVCMSGRNTYHLSMAMYRLPSSRFIF